MPYYDKASYGDLSDFFYVWLRYGLEDLYPSYFQTEVTPKKEELTAFLYRWNGDRQQANVFYAEGLNLAMKHLYESVSEDYPSTVAFQYTTGTVPYDGSVTRWETFVTAIYQAGFTITASWPLGRKGEEGTEGASKEIPITVVIRRKPSVAPQLTRRNFVALVKREIPGIVEDMGRKVEKADLRLAVIGPALNIFTRLEKVLDADGTAMRPYEASRIIEQEIDTILATSGPEDSEGE